MKQALFPINHYILAWVRIKVYAVAMLDALALLASDLLDLVFILPDPVLYDLGSGPDLGLIDLHRLGLIISWFFT